MKKKRRHWHKKKFNFDKDNPSVNTRIVSIVKFHKLVFELRRIQVIEIRWWKIFYGLSLEWLLHTYFLTKRNYLAEINLTSMMKWPHKQIRKLRTSRSFIFETAKKLENPQMKSLEPQGEWCWQIKWFQI